MRAEVLTILCSYFGRNDDFMNSFCNQLTFKVHTKLLNFCGLLRISKLYINFHSETISTPCGTPRLHLIVGAKPFWHLYRAMQCLTCDTQCQKNDIYMGLHYRGNWKNFRLILKSIFLNLCFLKVIWNQKRSSMP